jgi:hypothetical protein
MQVAQLKGEPAMDKHLLEALETAVAAAVARSDLGVSHQAAVVILRAWATAMATVERLREQRPNDTEEQIFVEAEAGAFQRVYSITRMVGKKKIDNPLIAEAMELYLRDAESGALQPAGTSWTSSDGDVQLENACGTLAVYRPVKDSGGRVTLQRVDREPVRAWPARLSADDLASAEAAREVDRRDLLRASASASVGVGVMAKPYTDQDLAEAMLRGGTEPAKHRVVALDAADSLTLAELCARLGLREAEVLRLALLELGERAGLR